MQVAVNGKTQELREGASLSELLVELDLDSVRVALELNRKLVVRKDHAETLLTEGDRIEIVTLVGGG